MPNYNYTARDWNGDVQTGTVFAETDFQLRDVLRQNGLFLSKFTKVEDQTSRRRNQLFRSNKVKVGDMVVMSRQFSTLIRAGLPIVEALSTVASQSENPILSEALTDVRLEVLSGASLSGAMRQHPLIFNRLFVALVEAGEAGGILEDTLEVAATQFDKEAVLREKVKSALTYPILVVIAAAGVVAFMLTFIVPTFENVYKTFKGDLPAVTQLLVSMSHFATKSWWVILAAIALFIYGFNKFRKHEKGKRIVDRALLKLWVVGPVVRKVALARFSQTWAGTTKGGVPIIQALTVSSETAGNSIISDAVLSVLEKVKAGSPVSPSLDQTEEFPPMMIRMIAAGERSGSLDFMLEEVSRYYERDVEYSVDRLTKMLEPAMTVIVGGIVLFVLLALYMPVFNLSNVIKK